MKTLLKTNRWICYVEKRSNLNNGNGRKEWFLVLRKICGNGDTGDRCLYQTTPNNLIK